MQSELISEPPPAPATNPGRKILRASHLGMCFGVRDAIEFALDKAVAGPLTVLGELVHNESVMAELAARGIRSESQVPKVETATVMVTAHGASQSALQRARDRGLEVLEATCPLVHYAHRSVAGLVAQGFHPVIIGQRGHVEVRGLTEDLAEYDVILTEEEARRLAPRPRFGVAAQTTQPVDRVRALVQIIRKQFPSAEVRFIDTVCQPTKQRQQAALELAWKSDAIVVVGGRHSNNTRQLAATCSRFCSRVFHVQSPDDLQAEWFNGAQTIGLTAGTSTPDHLIDEVEAWLRARLGAN